MPPVFNTIPQDRFHRRATVLGVVDGDTLDIEIDMGWSLTMKERVRLAFVNTPEKRGVEKKAGNWVKEMVAAWFPVGTEVMIESVDYSRTGNVRGKFGRTIAVLYRLSDGFCLNEVLLRDQLAWETDDDGSLVGERSLARLTGIPAELRI